MRKLSISHHERMPGHGHRWHVHLDDRTDPLLVELPDEERDGLELTDEEIHDLLPTALQRRVGETNRDDVLPAEEDVDVALEAPVRVYQTHFMG
jgi:hypothetical protein